MTLELATRASTVRADRARSTARVGQATRTAAARATASGTPAARRDVSLEIAMRRAQPGHPRSRLTVVSEPSTRAGVVVLRLAGVLDRHAVGTAREAMSGALRGHPREVVLEVSGLERVDHVASVVLTLMHRHAARCGARLAVVPGPG